jgi:hypothetical protein
MSRNLIQMHVEDTKVSLISIRDGFATPPMSIIELRSGYKVLIRFVEEFKLGNKYVIGIRNLDFTHCPGMLEDLYILGVPASEELISMWKKAARIQGLRRILLPDFQHSPGNRPWNIAALMEEEQAHLEEESDWVDAQ